MAVRSTSISPVLEFRRAGDSEGAAEQASAEELSPLRSNHHASSPPHRSPHHSHTSSQGSHPHQHHHSPAHKSPSKHSRTSSTDGGAVGGGVSSPTWGNLPTAINGSASANYPTAAAEILPTLKEKIAILSGGRDRQSQSVITFPAKHKSYIYERETVRRVVQYLASIPTDDVREYGFSVIIDMRNSNWKNTKVILRTLQEALPGQIHVVYTVQPAHFWQKQASNRGHSKEKAKLEFSTVMLSVQDRLIQHFELSQLTSDLGGFLPYNHEQWIKLRLDLEHFISSFNALMEHTEHVEQQLRIEYDTKDVEMAEEALERHLPMQDQLKKAPLNTIREGNELLRALEQSRDDGGTSSMTPDKINAIAIIKRLLDKIGRRQVQLDDLWRQRKVQLEQALGLRAFEKEAGKLRAWLKTRGEETIVARNEIGTTVEGVRNIEDQHDKFEAKVKSLRNTMTQLRRTADKFTGSQHYAAEGMQRTVGKLSARFTRFDGQLADRRSIVQGSVGLHSAMQEWRQHCELTTALLKQDANGSALPTTEQQLREHTERIEQLEQMAAMVLQEAQRLADLMEEVTKQALDTGKLGPDYSSGLDHVRRLTDEVDNHRKRVNQLAEARQLQLDQFRHLYSCERDAKQEAQWLQEVLARLASSHGDMGNSPDTTEQLLADNEKLSDRSKSSYKYACELLSPAHKTRLACSLDPAPNSALQQELGAVWGQLSSGLEENRQRLEMALQFNSQAEEILACYSDWTTPITKQQKSAQLIEDKIADISKNKDRLKNDIEEYTGLASSLIDRLCRPLLPSAPAFLSLNEVTRQSLSAVRAKVEELERTAAAIDGSLPDHQAVLEDFLRYVHFEHSIEQILKWLQEQGLRQILAFSSIAEDKTAVQEQLTSFENFHETCKEHTVEVERLLGDAGAVETGIKGFRSDLVKKATSLHAVWDKFMQRVTNRKAVLGRAARYYDNTTKAYRLLEELEAALQGDVIRGQPQGVEPYVNELITTKERTEKQINTAAKDGRSLVEIFQKAPIDVTDPASRVKRDMEQLAKKKAAVEKLWTQAWKLTDMDDKPTSLSVTRPDQTPSTAPVKSSAKQATDKPLASSGRQPVSDLAGRSGSLERQKEKGRVSSEGTGVSKAMPERAAVAAAVGSSGGRLPDHAKKSPDHVKKSPDHVKKSPDHVKKSPDHVKKSPDHVKKSPDHAKTLPDQTKSKASPEQAKKSVQTKPSPEQPKASSSPKHSKESTEQPRKPPGHIETPPEQTKKPVEQARKPVEQAKKPVEQARKVADPLQKSPDHKAHKSPERAKKLPAVQSLQPAPPPEPSEGGQQAGRKTSVKRRHSDRFGELEEKAYKHLEWLETECSAFFSRHANLGDTCQRARKMYNSYCSFLQSVEPTFTAIEEVTASLQALKIKAPPLATPIDQLCGMVAERLNTRKGSIQERCDLTKHFADFCSHLKETEEALQTLDDFLCQPVTTDTSTESKLQLLQEYKPVMETITSSYPQTKSVGEEFLSRASEMLSCRVGGRLVVGEACTSVAVGLGGLEGRVPDVQQRWAEFERSVAHGVDWQGFKVHCDQICSWLRNSAELFLQSRVDLGTSLETAEDLLSELEEFQARAKRTSSEVQSLVVRSELLLVPGHPTAPQAQVKERVAALRTLYGDFEARLEARGKSLTSAAEFYEGAQQLSDDMTAALDICHTGRELDEDLPAHLKIASVSTRLTNLLHQSKGLLSQVSIKATEKATKKGGKIKMKRSDSASATELSIKQALANLQENFTQYKSAFERRRVSPSPQRVLSPRNNSAAENYRASLSPQGGALSPRNGSSPPAAIEQQQQQQQRVSPSSSSSSPQHGTSLLSASKSDDKRSPEHKAKPQKTSAKELSSPTHRQQTVKSSPSRSSSGASKIDVKRTKSATPTSSPSHKPLSSTAAVQKEQTPQNLEDRQAMKTNRRLKAATLPSTSRSRPIYSAMESPVRVRVQDASQGQSITPPTKVEGSNKLSAAAGGEGSLRSHRSLSASEGSPQRQRKMFSGVKERVAALNEKVKKEKEELVVVQRTRTRSVGARVSVGAKPDAGPSLRSGQFYASSERLNGSQPSSVRASQELLQQPAETKAANLYSSKEIITQESPKHHRKVPPPIQTPPQSSSDTTVDHTTKTDHPQSPSSSSSPSAFSTPLSPSFEQGIPKVCKIVLKEHTPSKQRVIPINVPPQDGKVDPKTDHKDTKKGPKTDHKDTKKSAEMESKMDQRKELKMDLKTEAGRERREMVFSPVSKKPLKSFVGKVSSLRNMFDSKPVSQSGSTGVETKPGHTGVESKTHSLHSGSTGGMESKSPKRPKSPDPIPKMIPSTVKEVATPPSFSDPAPPPRPPSPVMLYLDRLSETSDDETDYDEFYSDSDLELESVDGPAEDVDSQLEKRVRRSLSVVLGELLSSELPYLRNLELLAETYLPSVLHDRVPFFLQGRHSAIFANISELYAFQRQFYSELSQCEDSVVGVCNTFIRYHDDFPKAYLPFLVNRERGAAILAEYGGTYLEEAGRAAGDQHGLTECYNSPWQRLVEYDQLLKELVGCALKQYLHGVTLVKEALQVVMKLMRKVDNAIVLNKLRGNPYSFPLDHMIRRDVFLVYTTSHKKKLREMHVILERGHVIFAQPVKERTTNTEEYHFVEGIETANMYFLEAYKGRKDKIALCEGKLSSESDFRVLQPMSGNLVLSQIWHEEVTLLLQNRPKAVCVGEELHPLPVCFQTEPSPEGGGPAEGGKPLSRFGSLRRRKSVKRSDSTVRRKPIARSVQRMGSFRGREAAAAMVGGRLATAGKEAEGRTFSKRDHMIKIQEPSRASVASADSVSVISPPAVDVQLGSIASSGEYQPPPAPSPNEEGTGASDEDLYIVVESFSSQREGFLSVKKGQVVEVLDDSGLVWMVLTVTSQPGELQAEGFLPAACLKPAGQAGFSRPVSTATISSYASQFGNQRLSTYSTVSQPPRPLSERYYAQEVYEGGEQGSLALVVGQAVEVLDAAPGEMWKVKTTDGHTGRESVGIVPKSCLGLKAPVRNRAQSEQFEAETGQEVLKQKAVDEVDCPTAPLPNLRTPSPPTLEGGGEGEGGGAALGNVALTASEEKLADQLCSEETTGQNLIGGAPGKNKETSEGILSEDGLANNTQEEDRLSDGGELRADGELTEDDLEATDGSVQEGLDTQQQQLMKRVEPVSDLSSHSMDASVNLDDTVTNDDDEHQPTSISMDALTISMKKTEKLARFETTSLDDVRQRQKRLSSDDFTHTQSTPSGVDMSEENVVPLSASISQNHPTAGSWSEGDPTSALSLSIRSLPATFSPAHKPGPAQQAFLGYDPMQIPTATMSQPSLAPPPAADRKRSTEIKAKARKELEQLQLATVKMSEDSIADFDPVDLYVAIADFEASERSNISVTAGDHVQVIDSSRSDWWLVVAIASGHEGWVPANYLEPITGDSSSDPASPPPVPFEDETGELQRLMMKELTQSELSLNRKQLYKSSFLQASKSSVISDEPSEAQLHGVFSIQHPYVAVTEVHAEHPGQLSLVQDQPVTVLDSKREDWWLVASIPEDSLPPVEGWVRSKMLLAAPYIREDSLEGGRGGGGGGGKGEGTAGVGSPPMIISPSAPPMWVVLADYHATEEGMMSVCEGELVELQDMSQNEWCLVRTTAKEPVEGWVPANYLKPYSTNSYESGRLAPRPYSSSSSSPEEEEDGGSDTPTELSERSSSFSPEGMEQLLEDMERRADARDQRRFVLTELVSTEREYVERLEYCMENYMTALEGPSCPKPLQQSAVRETLMGNLAAIYTFHKERILPQLVDCSQDGSSLGDAFLSAEAELESLYISYCQNKASSEDVYHEFAPWFEELRAGLKDRLWLADYLILPVQRITKYSLLLHNFHKYSVQSGEETGNAEAGLEVTKVIATRANNAIHLSMLEKPTQSEFGELVLQDLFLSQEAGPKNLFKERRVFLFSHALVIAKKRREAEKDGYVAKEKLMLSDISMRQDMDTMRRNIVIYDMHTGTKFTLRAPKTSVRDRWLTSSNKLIREAQKNSVSRNRSLSDPGDMVTRSPSLVRRSMFRREREGSKRKSVRRPHSSIGVRLSPSRDKERELALKPGSEYVVMECIVLEGGDDVTLEPGEVVELVRADGAASLRIRTQQEPAVEGTVPTSYLRRRDSVKGDQMETTPKFTMTPADLDLAVEAPATISCAFNGCPAPTVLWSKDGAEIASNGRRKITSCATSTVLEVAQLEHEDEGVYSCTVANAVGEDCTSMLLSIHGPPSRPQKPTVSKTTSTSVRLKWPVPEFDGSSPILSYQIEMLQKGFDNWQPIVQHPKSYFTVKTLEPNTSYQFRVIAYNSFGASRPGEASEVVETRTGGGPGGRKAGGQGLGAELIREYPDPKLLVPDPDLPLSPRPPFIRRESLSSTYDITLEIGRGRFGVVHRCVNKLSGAALAAKYVRLRSKRKAEVRREVEILIRIRGKSPHLLEFHEAFERGRNLIIVTELIPDGDLIDHIVAENDLTEGVAVGYLSQLLSAIDTLHQLNIAHMDIRPENILLIGKSNPTIKLIDFGAARDLSSDSRPLFTSSVEFCAPEVVNHEPPAFSSDMWSVGVLTYVLLSGISPFFVDNIQLVVDRIKEARYNFYNDQFEHISQEAKDFISALLQKSSEYRLSAATALQHTWVKTLGRIGSGISSPWPMARLDVSRLKTFNARRKWHSMAVAIEDSTVYGPRSMLCASPIPPDFEEMAKRESPPKLSDGPTHKRVSVGSSVTFQFKVSGSPEPSVEWEHAGLKLWEEVETGEGVTAVTLVEVGREEEGVYVCSAVNSLGCATVECHLTVLDIPGEPQEVNGVILGSYNSALISWLPPTFDGNCLITGYLLERRRLEYDVWEEVSSDIDSTAHVVEDLIPGVAYVFRVTACNEVGAGRLSNPSEPVTIAAEKEYDSESPVSDEAVLKTTPIELEYDLREELTRGRHASIRLCSELTTDRVFVAKVVPLEVGGALHEYELMHQLSHPRVVSLEDAYQSKYSTTLILEHVPGGSLAAFLKSLSPHPLDEVQASRFSRGIMEGLQYLHQTRIILVNLSPTNVLLTAGCVDVKLTDFGIARYLETGNQLREDELTGEKMEFMAPEAVAKQPLTTAADIWSAGCITFLMVTGSSPFAADSKEEVVSGVLAATLNPSQPAFERLTKDCKDFLLERTLAKNPRRRLTAHQCQRHRWVQANSQTRRMSAETNTYSRARRGSADGGRRH